MPESRVWSDGPERGFLKSVNGKLLLVRSNAVGPYTVVRRLRVIRQTITVFTLNVETVSQPSYIRIVESIIAN
jgi:hypothetical protein